MPYSNNADLPKSVRNALPSEAQTVWRTVFNQTEERHSDESRSTATAWTAVKNGWRKDDDGNWIRKAEGFTPPQAVRNNAKRGLEMRQKYGRGGLDTQEAGRQGIGSGVARARDLAAGKSVSAETIRRMVAFFARHEKNKDSRMPNGEPGAGMIAWALWGGDAGKRWAESIASRLEKGGDPLADRDFIIKNAKQRYTLGVVYEPGVVDTQGDFSDETEIEKACWNFMRKLQGRGKLTKAALAILDHIIKAAENGETVRVDITDAWDTIEKRGLNDMHVNTPWDEDLGEIVEIYCAPVDFELNGEQVEKGTWLMGVVWSEDHFTKVASGERTGYSMEGKGRRVKVDA